MHARSVRAPRPPTHAQVVAAAPVDGGAGVGAPAREWHDVPDGLAAVAAGAMRRRPRAAASAGRVLCGLLRGRGIARHVRQTARLLGWSLGWRSLLLSVERRAMLAAVLCAYPCLAAHIQPATPQASSTTQGTIGQTIGSYINPNNAHETQTLTQSHRLIARQPSCTTGLGLGEKNSCLACRPLCGLRLRCLVVGPSRTQRTAAGFRSIRPPSAAQTASKKGSQAARAELRAWTGGRPAPG